MTALIRSIGKLLKLRPVDAGLRLPGLTPNVGIGRRSILAVLVMIPFGLIGIGRSAGGSSRLSGKSAMYCRRVSDREWDKA